MEAVERIEKTWVNVVELKHPLADYIFMHAPAHNMAILIEFVRGVPYGRIYMGTAKLSVETLLHLLEARRRRKRSEDLCLVKRGNVVYVYLPERGYAAKFVNSELEYDIPDVNDYNESIYPLEDVAIFEKLKEICK